MVGGRGPKAKGGGGGGGPSKRHLGLDPHLGALDTNSTSVFRANFSRPGPQTIRHTNFLEEKGVLSDALRRSFSRILRERLAEHVKKGV